MRWLLLLALTGCLRNAAYPCNQESDCLRSDEQGVCEPTGFCSFADTTCPDGRRYGDLSGNFAGQCVAGETSDGGVDMPVIDPDMAIDMPPAAPFCDAANEPTLVGCWEFEDVLTDGSGDGNNATVTAGAVTFGTGHSGKAVQLDAAAHLAVADTASMAPTAVTIEGWINPTALPGAGLRMGIVDNNNSYGFFLQQTGLSCTVSVAVSATVVIPTNTFTHVACTFDGTTGTVYVDGTLVATAVGGTPLGAGDTSGTAIGGNSPTGDTLVGSIDQLRVWSVARTAQQICTAAGKSTCP